MLDVLMNISWGQFFNPAYIEKDETKDYIRVLGELVYHHNKVQSELLLLLLNLVDDYGLFESLWHNYNKDEDQRDLIKVVLKSQKVDCKQKILDGLSRAKVLSKYRNLLVHTPVYFEDDKYEVDGVGAKDVSFARLNTLKTRYSFVDLIKDYEDISDYIVSIILYLRKQSSEIEPLPKMRMPVLENIDRE